VPAVVCSLILASSIVAAVFSVWNDGHGWRLLPFLFVLANAVVGSLIELRRPGNTVGRLLLASALASSLGAAALEYTRYAVAHPASGLPIVAVLAGLPNILMPAASALLIFCVPLYFPDASQSSVGWRRLTRMAIVFTVAGLLIHTLRPGFVQSIAEIPNPFGLAILQPYDVALAALEAALMITALIIAVGRLFTRFRHATGDTRQQIKWLLYAVCAWITLVSITSAVEPFNQQLFQVLDSMLVLLFSGIPAAIGVAILRHRLYDIDLIINRTLVYAGLTAVIAALYAAIVVGLGALLQAQGSTALSLLATFLAAVLFSPIRSRLQHGVNRLLYGERADPYHALASLGQRLGGTLAPETVFATVVQTVGETLRL
ncbi:MAG TPA: hypothetical protein VFT99_18325, partial [Roseiflexaceae bacterium]|nr:hypothetical protein [Roseiflexaceae bacterium]